MILEARDLHCGYGADEIVHGVDVEIAQGSIVAILGPNGSGKSTFLKAMLGYLRITRGACASPVATSSGSVPARSRRSASATCRS